MNFQIYVSGRIQKLFKLKAKEITHESKLALSPNWLEVWRCEHVISDRQNTHLCVFTNVATYYSILLTSQEPHDFRNTVGIFCSLLMRDFKLAGGMMPPGAQISYKLIKGNPRSLIGVMNQQIRELDYLMEDGDCDLAKLQTRINSGIYGHPHYLQPKDEFVQNIIQQPPFPKGAKIEGVGPDNVLPFLN